MTDPALKSIEGMQTLARERRCLSPVYSSCGSVLLWVCAQGHRWEAIASSVKHRPLVPAVRVYGQVSQS